MNQSPIKKLENRLIGQISNRQQVQKSINLKNKRPRISLPNRKALKTQQVYKIKTDQNNQIIKYKARWVVKGFTQQYGVDYEEIFANTCRLEVYKMLLYLAAYHNWEIV